MPDRVVYTVRRKRRGYVFTCSNPRLHKLLGKEAFCTGFTVAEDPAVVVAHLQEVFPDAIVLFDDIVQERIELPDPKETVPLQELRDLPAAAGSASRLALMKAVLADLALQ